MYFVSPSKGEQFFLRLLLTIFEGRKSWGHLRTWNGQVFATFKEACMARGLLEDDHEWRICLKEAIAMQPGMVYCWLLVVVTNFIWPYLHQFFDDSHGLNGYGKHLKRPFNRYQSRLKEISIGQDIRQIN